MLLDLHSPPCESVAQNPLHPRFLQLRKTSNSQALCVRPVLCIKIGIALSGQFAHFCMRPARPLSLVTSPSQERQLLAGVKGAFEHGKEVGDTLTPEETVLRVKYCDMCMKWMRAYWHGFDCAAASCMTGANRRACEQVAM
jgi:hypothetical protein